MSKSYKVYPGDGETVTFSTPEYIVRDHIAVYVDGVEALAGWSWVSDYQITFDTAPASGARIVIERSTSPNARLVDYTNNTILSEGELNEDSTQSFFLAQEAWDAAVRALGIDETTGDWSGAERVLKNLSPGIDDTDAATVGQIGPFADAAATSASAASSSADEAEAARDAASLAADTATAAKDDVISRVDFRFASIAAMRSNTVSPTSGLAFLRRYYADTPGGAAVYDADPDDTVSADNGSTVIVDQAGTRWKIQVDDEVSLRSFGVLGDGDEETAVIQDALDLAAARGWTLRIPPAASGKYIIGALTVPSNSRVRFASNVVFEAVSGLGLGVSLVSLGAPVAGGEISNVHWECNGATFRGIKAEYVSGEHRHIFNIRDCSDVYIADVAANDGGGDGFYINGAVRLKLVRPKADNNRRNNMSVIDATDTYIDHPVLTNANGTLPESGLCFEPNNETNAFRNVTVTSPICTGNAGKGLTFYLDNQIQGTGESDDQHILVTGLLSQNNGTGGIRLNEFFGSYKGSFQILDFVSRKDGNEGLYIGDKGINAGFLRVTGTVIDPCQNASGTFPQYVGAMIFDTSSVVSGNMDVDVAVHSEDAGMQYAACVYGPYDNAKLRLRGLTGASVQPLWLNTASGTGRGLQVIVDAERIAMVYTSGTNLTGKSAGDLSTNAGAVGTVSLLPNETLPIGSSYRFRVVASQILRVGLGASLSGHAVVGKGANTYFQSSEPGAEMEWVYIGNSTWQPRVIAGTWTWA